MDTILFLDTTVHFYSYMRHKTLHSGTYRIQNHSFDISPL